MKLTVMTHIALPEGKDPKQRLDELSEESSTPEALGFSSAWHAEQHFTRFGIGSSALVVASHLAARTSTIRLGAGYGAAVASPHPAGGGHRHHGPAEQGTPGCGLWPGQC